MDTFYYVAVQLQFRVLWKAPVKAKRIKSLHDIAVAKIGVKSAENKDEKIAKMDEEPTYFVDAPKRSHLMKSASQSENSGVSLPAPIVLPRNSSIVAHMLMMQVFILQVWFHFLYHSMLRRMSEKRSDYSCTWCDMYAGSLRGLVAHLVCSHSRLRFQVAVRIVLDLLVSAIWFLSSRLRSLLDIFQVGHDNMAHIYVMATQPNRESELSASVSPSRCEIDINDDTMDRIEHHFSYVSPKKRLQSAKTPEENTIEERMHEFDELEELSKEQPQEFYAPLLQRQYFHSRTGAVVLDHEKDYDSDDDVDEEWIIKQSEKLLDEFEDVALEEKEFMKKWNRHVKENRCEFEYLQVVSLR